MVHCICVPTPSTHPSSSYRSPTPVTVYRREMETVCASSCSTQRQCIDLTTVCAGLTKWIPILPTKFEFKFRTKHEFDIPIYKQPCTFRLVLRQCPNNTYNSLHKLFLAHFDHGLMCLVLVLVKGRHLDHRDLLLYQRSSWRRRVCTSGALQCRRRQCSDQQQFNSFDN